VPLALPLRVRIAWPIIPPVALRRSGIGRRAISCAWHYSMPPVRAGKYRRARFGVARPFLQQLARPVEEGAAGRRGIREEDADLAVLAPPGGAAVPARHPHRPVAPLGYAGLVDDAPPARVARPRNDEGASRRAPRRPPAVPPRAGAAGRSCAPPCSPARAGTASPGVAVRRDGGVGTGTSPPPPPPPTPPPARHRRSRANASNSG